MRGIRRSPVNSSHKGTVTRTFDVSFDDSLSKVLNNPMDGYLGRHDAHCDVTVMPIEYWIEHVTFGLLYVMFRFSTRIFYGGVPGFATDCHCGVWCRGLTTCLLYVGPLLNIYLEMMVGF